MGRRPGGTAKTVKKTDESGKRLATPQALNAAIKGACDILRRSNCAGAMQYVPELTWVLFLRVFDELEEVAETENAMLGTEFSPALEYPYRWRDWGAPDGKKRLELTTGTLGGVKEFLNEQLFPHLRGLKAEGKTPTPRQKIVAEVLSGVERVRVDTDTNLLDVFDKVHAIRQGDIDNTHTFTLSQIYEGLLLKMGEKGNDGGQFFTPREVMRAMVRAIDPKVGEKVYDPCCGTGGFLAESFEHMKDDPTVKDNPIRRTQLEEQTFFGREKEDLVYPIALANLTLHGITVPHVWHGNTLTGTETYGGLFAGADALYDVILTNPPFGGKEGAAAQTNFPFKTNATQMLFLQHVMDSLKPGGRCGIVLDEGVLFKTTETAFVQIKRKLLREYDLFCIVSLPTGVFASAGAGVKTNLLFFTKGKPTERIWYYDLSDLKISKTAPMTLDHFEEFFALLPTRADSEKSWTVDFTQRRADAQQKAAPYKAQAEALGKERAVLVERSNALKTIYKAQKQPKQQTEIEKITDQLRVNETEHREAIAKAQEIEDSIYDLKAVNPYVGTEEIRRTPSELLDIIAAKGREVEDALTALRRTLAT